MPLLAEAKQHLRIEPDFTDEDSYLTGLIDAAKATIENDTGYRVSQTNMTLDLDAFEMVIELPLMPVVSVESISYLNTDGVLTELDSADWYLDLREPKAKLSAAYGKSWPNTYPKPEAVTIRYTVGAPDMPPPIKQAALLLIGHWYANREAVTMGVATTLPLAYERLIQPYKVHF